MKENLNKHINRINTNKYKELKNKFDKCIENTSKIITKIFEINKLRDNRDKIVNNKEKIEFINPYASDEAFESLKIIENFVKEKMNNNFQKLEGVKYLEKNEIKNDNKNDEIINDKEELNDLNYNKKDIINEQDILQYRSEINLIYKTREKGKHKIFDEIFVKNNINNIELIINGIKSKLISEIDLKEKENNIKLIIKKN